MKQVPIFLLLLGTIFGLPPSDRIWGGTIATLGQLPYMASLNAPEHFCGAVIINQNWVLTAAHCLYLVTSITEVLVGTIFQHAGGTRYGVLNWIQHEAYNSSSLENDIGLIQIDGTFSFGETIQAIEIGDAATGATCVASGWGSSDVNSFPEELRFVELTVLSVEDCISRSADAAMFYLGPEQVCTLGPEGIGLCLGDAGGPLTCGGRLAGIVSYLVHACAKELPDVYVRLSTYADWIAANAQ